MLDEWQPILAQPENGGLFVAFEELVSLLISSLVSLVYLLVICSLFLCFGFYIIGTSPFLRIGRQEDSLTGTETDSKARKKRYSWSYPILIRVALSCLTGVALYRLGSAGDLQLAESNLFLFACLGIIPLSMAMEGALRFPRFWIVLLAAGVFCIDMTLLYSLFLLLVIGDFI